MKSHEETGLVVQANSEFFGDELRAIAAISDLLSEDITNQASDESQLTDYHRGALIDGVKALAKALYERLVFAVGNEDAFAVGIIEARKMEERK